MKLYYWLFARARNPLARWAWRKWSGVLTAGKHLRRGNQVQAARWIRFVAERR